MARFIGMTSHTDGQVMARAIARHDLDCVQMALNASRNGRFEELALPAARRKNLGVIAMKVAGQEFLLGSGPGSAGAQFKYTDVPGQVLHWAPDDVNTIYCKLSPRWMQLLGWGPCGN
jgi:aryl-alcohol dehydrogenase-like predicted oxidoreductase